MGNQHKIFHNVLQENGLNLTRLTPKILQINVGKLCNQACSHCHVDAGPYRKEIMQEPTWERIIELIKKNATIHTVDLTGGAPELNPWFRSFVAIVTKMGKKIIDRCNLTILFEKGQENTAQFLAQQQVHLIASLPCYTQKTVDKQRGNGVFDKSIQALKILNDLGYGKKNSGLEIDLVFNPSGPFLPPPQPELEQKYKQELKSLFDIEFNRLFTITNMPISRFSRDLERSSNSSRYMDLLISNFNPHAAAEVMCRELISVSWNGHIFDCDFNQMLEISLGNKNKTIWNIDDFSDLIQEPIEFRDHCFGCTAGSGSSCQGALS